MVKPFYCIQLCCCGNCKYCYHGAVAIACSSTVVSWTHWSLKHTHKQSHYAHAMYVVIAIAIWSHVTEHVIASTSQFIGHIASWLYHPVSIVLSVMLSIKFNINTIICYDWPKFRMMYI